MDKYELFIVGAGAAGMSAAVSAWEAGTRSVLIADRARSAGGILPQCLHEGFGLGIFGRELTGPEFAGHIIDELGKTGAELSLDTTVISVSEDRTAVLSSPSGLRRISFEKMILATGCRENNIGMLAVSGTRPSGVFTAGQAQELINMRRLEPGQEVVILGSGDLGMIMARRFTLEGKHVIAVIEKEKSYGGMARNYRRCIERYSIPLVCRAEITRIHGEKRIEAVTVHRLDTDTSEIVRCDTLVTALGLSPERALTAKLGQPYWLRFCGNCSRVHDIVDSAVEEARRTGRTFGAPDRA
jgi:thioredoxin reductase